MEFCHRISSQITTAASVAAPRWCPASRKHSNASLVYCQPWTQTKDWNVLNVGLWWKFWCTVHVILQHAKMLRRFLVPRLFSDPHHQCCVHLGATAHCLIGVQCTVFTLSDIKGMAMALNHTSVPILRPATTCKFRHCFCVSRNPIPIYTRLLACQAYVCQLLESDSLNLQSGESDHRWRILLSFPTCVNHKLRPNKVCKSRRPAPASVDRPSFRKCQLPFAPHMLAQVVAKSTHVHSHSWLRTASHSLDNQRCKQNRVLCWCLSFGQALALHWTLQEPDNGVETHGTHDNAPSGTSENSVEMLCMAMVIWQTCCTPFLKKMVCQNDPINQHL